MLVGVPDPAERITPRQWGGNNLVCWPSVGDIIIVQRFSKADLDFVGFDLETGGLEWF